MEAKSRRHCRKVWLIGPVKALFDPCAGGRAWVRGKVDIFQPSHAEHGGRLFVALLRGRPKTTRHDGTGMGT